MITKLASLPMDVTDFVLAQNIDYLAQITKGKDALVKTARIPTTDELDEHPDKDFAAIMTHPHMGTMRKFACYDKNLVELNMLILEDSQDKLPKEIIKTAAHNLERAAKKFRLPVSDSFHKLAQASDTGNKVLLEYIDELAWIKKQGDMEKKASHNMYALESEKKYPIDTPQLLKIAADYFDRYYRRFTPSERLEYAQNVKVASEKLHTPIMHNSLKMWSELTNEQFNKYASENILLRMGYASEDQKHLYKQLSERFEKMGVEKTAAALEKIDKATGVNSLWNASVADPIMAVYGRIEKRASMSYDGKEIDIEDLNDLNDLTLDKTVKDSLLGPNAVENFNKLPKQLRTKIAESIHEKKEKEMTDKQDIKDDKKKLKELKKDLKEDKKDLKKERD